MIDLLTQLVNHESFTPEKDMVDKLGAFLREQVNALNADSVEVLPQTEVGDMILAKWNPDAPGKPLLFLVHMDTVFPSGTLKDRPVRIEDGKLYGPGAVDMKAGIVICLTAIRGLQERDELPQRPIWLLMTGDEETGSTYSAGTIKDLAQHTGLVMVMEPGTPTGAIKGWRKGIATYTLSVEGRASHAGNAPQEGINAIIEFAQQAMEIHALNDIRNGTSVSLTMVQGGTAGNVIPALTEAYIDVRVMSQNAMQKIDETLRNRQPFMPGATVNVRQNHYRPPMERNEAALTQVKAIGGKVGVTVRIEGVGGGSDGNLTAALGIPTLDGLGAQGDGLHAIHEHVIISSLTERAALVAGILKHWDTDA